MAITSTSRALRVLADHNLFVGSITNHQWDRFVDTSSSKTLEAVGEALAFLGANRRERRLQLMAEEAKSVAAILGS